MTALVTPQDAVLLALVFSRLIAMLMAFPFLNTTMLPTNIKIFLILTLAFFFIKNLHLHIDIGHFSLYWLFLLIAKELILGFAMGLLINFFISAFSYAAEIVSYFMGITVVNIFDPSYGQVSVLSKFFIMLFYAIFFVSGAYEYFLKLIAMSFVHIPLDLPSLDQGIWRYVIEQSVVIFGYAFKLAFPFALILYLINLALALINRLIPQINVFIVGLPLQIFVGIASLAFGIFVAIYVGVSLLQEISYNYGYFIKHVGH